MLSMRTNIMNLSAIRHVNTHYDAMARSIAKLSSGKRIVSAQDDPAGSAVASTLRERIATINQGTRNANDAISMLQVAEGAMNNTSSMLIRVKQLAEQASTGSYSKTQRNIINAEMNQLIQEINRTAQDTKFNDIALLDRSSEIAVHIDQDSQIQLHNINITAESLGLDAVEIGSKTPQKAKQALTAIDNAIQQHNEKRTLIGSQMNTLQTAIEVNQIQAENLSAAKSRIEDVDYASEVAELTEKQVLAQASVAMAAQSNNFQKDMINKLLNG